MLDSIAPEKRLDYLDKQLNQKRQVKFKTCADVYDHWRAYKRSYKKAPRDGIEFQIDYIDTGLALNEEARAKAPIALALHGAPGSYHDFALLIQHLSQQNVRVIAPNWPEYVATVKTKVLFRHSADEKAAYLRDFLKAIHVNKIDLLVSHSSAIFPTLLILLNANNEAIKRQKELELKQKLQSTNNNNNNNRGVSSNSLDRREKLEQQKNKQQLVNNLAIKNKDIVVLTTTNNEQSISTVGADHSDQNNVGTENNRDQEDETMAKENKSNGFVEMASVQRLGRRDEQSADEEDNDDDGDDDGGANQTSISIDGNNNNNMNVNRNQKSGDYDESSSAIILQKMDQLQRANHQCDSTTTTTTTTTTLTTTAELNSHENKKRRHGKRRKGDSDVIVKFDQPIEIKAVALLNPAGHRLPKSMKPTWFKCGSVHIYQQKFGRSLFRKFGPAFLTVVGVPVKVDNMDNVMLSATVMRNSKCQRVIKQLEQLSQMKIPTLLVFSENDKLIEKEIFYEMTQFMKLDQKNFDIFNNDGNIELSRKYPPQVGDHLNESRNNKLTRRPSRLETESIMEDWIRVMVFKAGGHYAYSNYAKTVNKAVTELLRKVLDQNNSEQIQPISSN